MSRLLRIAYRLRYHEFAGWALDRWLMTLAFAAGLLIWLAGRRDPGWTAGLESRGVGADRPCDPLPAALGRR